MTYDFDLYSGAHLITPTKPRKPTIGRNPSSIEARAFADALEEYEREFRGYEEDKRWYLSERSRLDTEFRDKLKKDYSLSDEEFDVLWSEAYEQGHSGGIREMYNYFDRLYEFVLKYNSIAKK